MGKANEFLRAARENGEKSYFDGAPCPYGHLSKKLVSNSQCTECKKISQRPNGKATLAAQQERFINQLNVKFVENLHDNTTRRFTRSTIEKRYSIDRRPIPEWCQIIESALGVNKWRPNDND